MVTDYLQRSVHQCFKTRQPDILREILCSLSGRTRRSNFGCIKNVQEVSRLSKGGLVDFGKRQSFLVP
jgi:hypothetical protein